VNVRTAWLSVLATLAILGFKARSDWEMHSVNCRGATLPGSLEAHWTFDDMAAGVLHDSSGNGLNGTLRGATVLADGVRGKAIRLNGENDYVDFGHPVELRLMGSMTISAWIDSASFPPDDAAIVSCLTPGYQLDTTVDMGPRTIAFKIADPCGNSMIRYGATELARDTWYHVAGVYVADAQSLNVYLNGHLDDGFLNAPVAAAQAASSQRVLVGRRPDPSNYQFAGLIDDVRIYSRALEHSEIEQAMNGVAPSSHPQGKVVHALASKILKKRFAGKAKHCHQPTRPDDAQVPCLMVVVGVLSALDCAGFWPGNRLSKLCVSLAVGLLVYPAAALVLPSYASWMIPALSLAGGASVSVSH
jgi:hypothetical protein